MTEPEEWGLVVPFLVCRSRGGRYDDDSFAAGAQLGMLYQRLEFAALAGADQVTATVFTSLVANLELVGMAHGFPLFEAATVPAGPDHPAMPEWSKITFRRGRYPETGEDGT